MPGTALFGSAASRGQTKNLVEFKAGKMTLKETMVYPDKRKGLVYIYQSDDSLMHFCWKDRSNGSIEDVSCGTRNPSLRAYCIVILQPRCQQFLDNSLN